MTWANTSNFYITTSGTSTSAQTAYVLQPAAHVEVPATPKREDEVAWLRRRVSEITELIAA